MISVLTGNITTKTHQFPEIRDAPYGSSGILTVNTYLMINTYS